ncbi:Protein of unknown function, DUF488 [Sporosarcina newyorkensis]|uniref:DNA repair protein n=1 Tax=Sporosarcina newyorkensis TaxID=759851 RepID=A0A1T4Y1U6_9BACL|nr:DUF488 domain-containing protein [Sporosarcina aquimarina]MBY0221492.1 DUF488 domain-containing protein [Sporosarcina aquimarina]SKA95265.1 Protein of unknown function, DUF488 [Sporosarcina newyorkensis]
MVRGGEKVEIYTIGHSTHTKEEFLKLLDDANIERLIDIRAFPGSRKFPHFHEDLMKEWLPANDIAYEHCGKLGGRRRKSKTIDPEINDAWDNQSFHNYADYTLTADFKEGVDQLMEKALKQRIAICCSERHPARCHRLLISNWLALHGWEVKHIIDGPKEKTLIEDHVIGKWGPHHIVLESNGTVIYPPGPKEKN